MNPTVTGPELSPTPPLFNAPYTNPMGPPPVVSPASTSGPEAPKPKSKLPMIIIALAVFEFLLIVGLIAALASQSSAKSAKTSTKGADSSQSQEPKAATAIGVQQASDAISADITSLNVDTDFAPDRYSDKALGL